MLHWLKTNAVPPKLRPYELQTYSKIPAVAILISALKFAAWRSLGRQLGCSGRAGQDNTLRGFSFLEMAAGGLAREYKCESCKGFAAEHVLVIINVTATCLE